MRGERIERIRKGIEARWKGYTDQELAKAVDILGKLRGVERWTVAEAGTR
jgi:hypothetical protein